MKAHRRIIISFSCAAALSLTVATTARADDADKAACASLDEGDACTRGDGDPGVCQPDDSSPNVLSCDDDGLATGSSSSGGGTSDDSGGCTMSHRRASSSVAGLVLGAAAIVAAARRRRGENV